MTQRFPNRSIGLWAALLAALLSLAPVSSTFAGNGGDSEEQGTPIPDPVPQDDGDESTPN